MASSYVFVRIRNVMIQNISRSFLEFFVELHELYDPVDTQGKLVLQWPSSLGRFRDRIQKKIEIFDTFEICLVNSEAPSQVQKRTIENVRSSGMWIS